MTCDECLSLLGKSAADSTTAVRTAFLSHILRCPSCAQATQTASEKRDASRTEEENERAILGAGLLVIRDLQDPESSL